MMKCVIVVIARNENLYINEWIKHHIDLGIEEILLYDNYSKIPLEKEVDKLPNKYKTKVHIELESISPKPQKSSYYKGKTE